MAAIRRQAPPPSTARCSDGSLADPQEAVFAVMNVAL
jgi:hypothetical protein